MSLERELAELYAALRLPTVGHLTQQQELDQLAKLIARYPEQTRQILADHNHIDFQP